MKSEPFNENAFLYDAWFERNRVVFESELRAIQKLLPDSGYGVEIGAGSGRFAARLGIKVGVEPSETMRKLAEKRGLKIIGGAAEALPFDQARFDYVLMVTTICFVDDLDMSLNESYRVLKPGGSLVVGFIDKESPIGRLYRQNKEKSVFYRVAVFYSVDDIISRLRDAGFGKFNFAQTIFNPLRDIKSMEPVKEGYGEGSFVVVSAIK